MITLDIEQIIHLHDMLIKKTGGLEGLRDRAALESAIYHSYASFDGKDLYPSIVSKITRQTYALISNHPFTDGNKRIGVFVMLVMLDMNNIKMTYTQKELIDLGLSTAQGKIDAEGIYSWIMLHKK